MDPEAPEAPGPGVALFEDEASARNYCSQAAAMTASVGSVALTVTMFLPCTDVRRDLSVDALWWDVGARPPQRTVDAVKTAVEAHVHTEEFAAALRGLPGGEETDEWDADTGEHVHYAVYRNQPTVWFVAWE